MIDGQNMDDKGECILKKYHSPYGDLILGTIGERLCLCDWATAWKMKGVERLLKRAYSVEFREGSTALIDRAISELDEYFAGRRLTFDIPLIMTGSAFQKRVWSNLLEIPYGSVISYSDLANRISQPNAVRAVANAIGANILSIFIQCHRVVGKDNSLTGYRGGLDVKRSLLQIEFRIKDKNRHPES